MNAENQSANLLSMLKLNSSATDERSVATMSNRSFNAGIKKLLINKCEALRLRVFA